MTANTPTQGFTYPLASDRPCDYPTTMAALAAQLDAKGQSFDGDVARLVARKLVKISKTNFQLQSNGIAGNPFGYVPDFDTVEINRGTSTDLTIDSTSLVLPAGFWLLYAKVIVPTSSANGNDLAKTTNPTASTTSGDTTGRDFGTTWTPVAHTWLDQRYIASGTGKVSMTFQPANTAANTVTVNYATLAAWWIADP